MKRAFLIPILTTVIGGTVCFDAREAERPSRVRVVPMQYTQTRVVSEDSCKRIPYGENGYVQIHTDTESGYQEHILLSVTMPDQPPIVFTPANGSGYDPVVQILTLSDCEPCIFYQCATGGNGGMTDTAVYRVCDDQVVELYTSIRQTKDLPYHAQAEDGYCVRVSDGRTQSTVDVRNLPAEVLSESYNADGKLIAEPDIWISGVVTVQPIYLGETRGWMLVEFRELNWNARVNRIGYITAPLAFTGDGFCPERDPAFRIVSTLWQRESIAKQTSESREE